MASNQFLLKKHAKITFGWLPTEMGRIWVRFLGFHRASAGKYCIFTGIRKGIPPIRKSLLLWVEKFEKNTPSSGWMEQIVGCTHASLSSHGWQPFGKAQPGHLWVSHLHNINSASCSLVTELNFNGAIIKNMHICCIIPPWIICDWSLIWTSGIWDRMLKCYDLKALPFIILEGGQQTRAHKSNLVHCQFL